MMYLVVCWVDVYVELSIWKRWLSSRGVFQVDVLLQERCLLKWGVCLYEVFAYMRCLPQKGKVSTQACYGSGSVSAMEEIPTLEMFLLITR